MKLSSVQLRKKAVRWAKRMHEVDALVIDTESTGGSRGDELIDIGVVRVTDGAILYDSLVKPTSPMNYYAFKCHGITNKELKDAPSLVDIYKDIIRILDGKHLIAYNKQCDQRIIGQSFDKYGLPKPSSDWNCLMRAFSAYLGISRHITLTAACVSVSALPGTHRAVTDALAAARVVYRMKQEFNPLLSI